VAVADVPLALLDIVLRAMEVKDAMSGTRLDEDALGAMEIQRVEIEERMRKVTRVMDRLGQQSTALDEMVVFLELKRRFWQVNAVVHAVTKSLRE
jgi:hypothetical protein